MSLKNFKLDSSKIAINHLIELKHHLDVILDINLCNCFPYLIFFLNQNKLTTLLLFLRYCFTLSYPATNLFALIK